MGQLVIWMFHGAEAEKELLLLKLGYLKKFWFDTEKIPKGPFKCYTQSFYRQCIAVIVGLDCCDA